MTASPDQYAITPPSAATMELIAKGREYYLPTYKPRETVLERGEGARVWDKDGNEYIDFGSGIAVTGLGHCDPDLVRALTAQAHKIWHTSNVFYTEPPILLAEALVNAAAFAKHVFFCNSGAEANEAAIKLSRKYAADRGRPPERREIITFTGSFHGRTLATVTATAQPKYHAGFEPLPPGFVYAPFNDEAAVRALASDKTCAILVEPIQGEGGITPAKPGFLKLLRELCDQHDALLIFDEIQCGMGRTGTLFAYEQEHVTPDVVTLAKGLGGGFPIGAMLVGEKAAETLQFGSHGTTFGGNPMATAVAKAALEKLQSDAVKLNVVERGEQLRAALHDINAEHGLFTEIRGRGLMLGAELKPEWHGKAGDITEAARQRGILILQAGPNVLRIMPPLTVTPEEMHTGIQRLKAAILHYLAR